MNSRFFYLSHIQILLSVTDSIDITVSAEAVDDVTALLTQRGLKTTDLNVDIGG